MTKGRMLNEIYDALPEDRRRAIETRAAEKIEAIRGLQALRKLAGVTQAGLSERLGQPQGNISRLENNSDMLLSTLSNYVEALGGKLRLTVELPDAPPIDLSGIGEFTDRTLP